MWPELLSWPLADLSNLWALLVLLLLRALLLTLLLQPLLLLARLLLCPVLCCWLDIICFSLSQRGPVPCFRRRGIRCCSASWCCVCACHNEVCVHCAPWVVCQRGLLLLVLHPAAAAEWLRGQLLVFLG